MESERRRRKNGNRRRQVSRPPNVHAFRGDVFALKVLVDAFMPQISPAFDEMQKQVRVCRPSRRPCRRQTHAATLALWPAPPHLAALLTWQFATEFDYRGEAQNAIDVRANLQRSQFKDKVIVPRVHQHLCSKRLMVMEEIYPSVPLHDALDQQAALLAKQRGVTKEQFIKSEKARIDREVLEAAKRGKQLAAHPNHPRAFGRPS